MSSVRRGTAGALTAVLLAFTAAPAVAAAAGPRVVRHLTDPRITESSSLVPSALHPGIWWTSNDSGGNSRLYAVGEDGRTVATYTVGGAPERDWEAMAPARDAQGRPAVVVGDIGDNDASRSNGILLHVVTEPARLTGGALDGPQYRLRYPDGPHDAESLVVDAAHHRLLVATKELLGGGFYAAPWPLPSTPTVLRRVADAPAIATDAALLPDGRIVVRDYQAAWVYSSDLTLLGSFDLPDEPQGESVAVAADPRSLLVGSEGKDSAVWQVPLPTSLAAPARTTSADRAPATASSGPGLRPYVVGAAALAALLALVAVAAGASRRRRRNTPW